MTVVSAAELNGALGGFCEGHSGAATFPEDAFVGDIVIFRLAAKVARRNLLQFLSRVHGDRVRGARHRVGCLTAARRACPGQVLPRVSPGDFAFFPRHAEQFSDHAMHIAPGLGTEIADPGLNIDFAIGLDDEQPIKARRPAGVTADRHSNATHFRTVPLAGMYFSFIPFELLGPTIERFPDERARGICLLPIYERPERSLSRRSIDSPQSALIDSKLARGLCENRFHDRDALHSAG